MLAGEWIQQLCWKYIAAARTQTTESIKWSLLAFTACL